MIYALCVTCGREKIENYPKLGYHYGPGEMYCLGCGYIRVNGQGECQSRCRDGHNKGSFWRRVWEWLCQ